MEDRVIDIIEYELDEENNEMLEKVENKERFQVDSIDKANWAFRKLEVLKIQENQINEVYNGEKERIDTWKEKELKSIENSKAFFEGLLTEYLFIEREKNNDEKLKISTPYGAVTTRKQQDKFTYDNDTFIAWAEENDHKELVRVKKEPVKADVKKTFTLDENYNLIDEETGEVVQGIIVQPQADKVIIKTNE